MHDIPSRNSTHYLYNPLTDCLSDYTALPHHISHDRDDQSWGDSTIEEILGPMNFKTPPPKDGVATGGGIEGDLRPPSAMNDDLPRTPIELCEVTSLL